jgi:hypothetical protein
MKKSARGYLQLTHVIQYEGTLDQGNDDTLYTVGTAKARNSATFWLYRFASTDIGKDPKLFVNTT